MIISTECFSLKSEWMTVSASGLLSWLESSLSRFILRPWDHRVDGAGGTSDPTVSVKQEKTSNLCLHYAYLNYFECQRRNILMSFIFSVS